MYIEITDCFYGHLYLSLNGNNTFFNRKKLQIIILGNECRDRNGILCARMTETALEKEYFCRDPDDQEMCRKSCDKCGEPIVRKPGKSSYTLTAKYHVMLRLSNPLKYFLLREAHCAPKILGTDKC